MRKFALLAALCLALTGCGAAEVTPQTTMVPAAEPTQEAAQEPTTEPITGRPTTAPATGGATGDLASCTYRPADVPGAQFDQPELVIDPAKSYTAILKTEKGDVTIELLPEFAPCTVNSFVFLARNGFYDNVTFHRVIPSFVAQTGDPTGTGTGGPGYQYDNEYDPASGLDYTKAGVLGMANAGPGTNGSQFFITYGNVGLPPADYTIFGQVSEGQEILEEITARDPSLNPSLPEGDTLYTIEIVEE